MRRRAFVRLAGLSWTVALAAASATGSERAGNWPQFRGTHAAGVGDGAKLDDAWDATAGKGVLWKARIPGLAHSSPIVWGDWCSSRRP